MIILGVDPGYAIVGYGAISAQGGRFRPVEYGAHYHPGGDGVRRTARPHL